MGEETKGGYRDAHCHLHDKRLSRFRNGLSELLSRNGIRKAAVNATGESDWEAVAEMARSQGQIVPSFGIHPWFVRDRSEGWEEKLRQLLERFPAGVGEIGLDRWIEDYDIDDQIAVFERQLDLASELGRPASIHCLQAWGHLMESLRRFEGKLGPFMLHSFGGSAEIAREVIKLGGFVSLSGYFFHERKRRQLEVFLGLPEDRVLLETDAPDMLGPDECVVEPLEDEKGEAINHPANLSAVYRAWARALGRDEASVREQANENFDRFFGWLLGD